ncbi:MAG: AI-2E family transporter [Desulfobacterales bacterium]|nr:AI-2E family transporter [Desulfobacterales bacterium]
MLKGNMQNLNISGITVWFFWFMFILSIVLLLWLLRPFLSIIVLGAVITGIFTPFYTWLKKKLSPITASLLTCIIIFFIVFIPLVFLITTLTAEANQWFLLAKQTVLDTEFKAKIIHSQLFVNTQKFFSKLDIHLNPDEIIKQISELVKFTGYTLVQQGSTMASNILGIVVNFFLMMLIIFYLLIDGHKLIAFISKLSPLPDNQDSKVIQKFKDMGAAVMLGTGLSGLIQGTLGGILFVIFGLNSAIFWGMIMSMIAFLPIIGIGVVLIPTSLYLFASGRIISAILMLIFYIMITFIVEYGFKPKIVGNRVQMHTLLVFLSIMGGLKVFGILGIIYGPLIVTFFLTQTDMYYQYYHRMID